MYSHKLYDSSKTLPRRLSSKQRLFATFLSTLAWVSADALLATRALAQAGRPGATSATVGATGTNAPAASKGSTSLETIVVTAQKREQKLLQVGATVSAFKASTLTSQGVTNLQGLAKLVPGLIFSNDQGGAPVPTLRGVGFLDISLAAQPDVAVYLDQFPLSVTALTKGVNLDLARVEVLKGPQGTLFGENATGGAINYITAAPTQTFQAGIDATYQRFNEGMLNAYVSGPLTDTLSGRLSFNTDQGGAYQKSYTRSFDNTLGDRDFNAARLQLKWDPTADLRVTFNLAGWKDNSDGQAPQIYGIDLVTPVVANGVLGNYPLAPRNPRAADWNPATPPSQNDKFYQANLRVDYNLTDNLIFTNLSQYVEEEVDDRLDSDGTDTSDVNYEQTGTTKSFYEEARLSNGSHGRFRWLVGATYHHDDIDEYTRQDLQGNNDALFYSYLANLSNPSCPASALTLPVPNNTFPAGCLSFPTTFILANDTTEAYGAFTHLEYDILPNLTLKGGLRYTHDKETSYGCTGFDPTTAALYRALEGLPFPSNGCLTINEFTPTAPFTPVSQQLTEHNFPWSVGVDWKPFKNLLLYTNISRGFKAGGFPALSASVSDSLRPVTQEELTAYEIGLKSTVLPNLVVEGAGFHYDYSNKQVAGKVIDPMFGPLNALVNVPKSTVNGTELSITWRPLVPLTLAVSGTYLQTRVDRFQGYNGDGVEGDFSGSPLPYAPKFSGNFDAEYRTMVSDNLYMFFGGHVLAQSQDFSVIGPRQGLDNLPGYATLDLRAGIEPVGGAWRAEVFGTNVTNTYYVTSENRPYDTFIRYVGRPAVYGLTLSYKFH